MNGQMAANPLFKSPVGQQLVFSLYDTALSRWPVACRLRQVDTSLGKTAVIDFGKTDAPALVLLHGASSNATSWIADAGALAERFRVYAVDVIGEPGKSAPARPPMDTDAYAVWLAEVLQGLSVRRASLMGLSQGGWIALKYAVTHPETVDRLVLLTPGGITPTKPSFLLTAVLFTMTGKWGVEKLNRYVFGKAPMDGETRTYMNAIMEHFTPRFSREYIFTDAELKRLTMPVLYIGGTDDVIRDNARNIRRLESLVPGLESRLLPGTGHVLIGTGAYTVPFLTTARP